MKQSDFTKKVVASIEQFFKKSGENNIVFTNELHLQMYLSQHLMKKWSLYFEQRVPTNGKAFKNNVKSKEDFPWRTKEGDLQDMYVDLVVSDDKEYLPIEIKYKTKGLVADGSLFGRQEKQMTILKNQGAQDLGMYGFWKDVRRVEMLCKAYPTVKNGISIFVTNDPYYIESPKGKDADKVNHYAFRMTEGRTISGLMAWKNKNSKIAASYPEFKLDGQYTVHWEEIGAHGSPCDRADFSYCMVVIP